MHSLPNNRRRNCAFADLFVHLAQRGRGGRAERNEAHVTLQAEGGPAYAAVRASLDGASA